MKTQAFAKAIRIASVAALLAFACSGPAAHAQFAQGENAAPHVSIDRDFLIGTWSNQGDCATSVAFTPDGAYATADGLEGQWSLTGDTLTLSGEAGATRLTIVPIDRNTMEVIGEDGSHDRSTRCAGISATCISTIFASPEAAPHSSSVRTAEPGRPFGPGRPVRRPGVSRAEGFGSRTIRTRSG